MHGTAVKSGAFFWNPQKSFRNVLTTYLKGGGYRSRARVRNFFFKYGRSTYFHAKNRASEIASIRKMFWPCFDPRNVKKRHFLTFFDSFQWKKFFSFRFFGMVSTLKLFLVTKYTFLSKKNFILTESNNLEKEKHNELTQ